jgi:hypothetical protein
MQMTSVTPARKKTAASSFLEPLDMTIKVLVTYIFMRLRRKKRWLKRSWRRKIHSPRHRPTACKLEPGQPSRSSAN